MIQALVKQSSSSDRPSQILSARLELGYCLQILRGIAKLELPTETIEEESKKILIRYTPLEVAVGTMPWDFPLSLAVGKIAPAVVTGNVIVIKPSPYIPYGGLKLIELAQRCFPPGVVQALSVVLG